MAELHPFPHLMNCALLQCESDACVRAFVGVAGNASLLLSLEAEHLSYTAGIKTLWPMAT